MFILAQVRRKKNSSFHNKNTSKLIKLLFINEQKRVEGSFIFIKLNLKVTKIA